MYSTQTYHQPTHKEDPKLATLHQDNIHLENALKQLNDCYQQKISLLQHQLQNSKSKEEALLQWKSSYIDKELFNNAKYEQEIDKLLNIIEQLTNDYQQTQNLFQDELQQKDQQINQIKQQNAHLKHQKETQQLKIQSLAQKYIVEIERLNNQLKQLKEEVNYDDLTQKQAEDQEKEEEENPTFRNSRETPFEEPLVQEEFGEHSIIEQNLAEISEEGLSVLKEQDPLRDISNKNSRMFGSGEKSSFMNGAVRIYNQLGH